ncbi:hypothetical protein SJ05684_c14660 [Sinorhizobium sojae CCBAU 05684]|uniref:Uncharacterized protein n=1 Tax=Sinorhizobium sojae CCBAU 05684 TaxID=716928 RepID=A0A249PAI0_9HYPH|nr:hypothetical protein SJ05684_c14660 [Sinorhizobium sojae CCBAU 05684]
MAFVELAPCTHPHQSDRQEDEEHASDDGDPLEPIGARFSPDKGGRQGRGWKNAGWREHRHHDRLREQYGVEGQGQHIQQRHPRHPGTDDLGRSGPGPLSKQAAQVTFETNVTRAAREKARDFSHGGRILRPKLNLCGRASPTRRSCVLLDVHATLCSGASAAGKHWRRISGGAKWPPAVEVATGTPERSRLQLSAHPRAL